VDNPEIHRKINDVGGSAVDLWSAQKIKTEIFNALKDWTGKIALSQ
jgi:hypothetical protein